MAQRILMFARTHTDKHTLAHTHAHQNKQTGNGVRDRWLWVNERREGRRVEVARDGDGVKRDPDLAFVKVNIWPLRTRRGSFSRAGVCRIVSTIFLVSLTENEQRYQNMQQIVCFCRKMNGNRTNWVKLTTLRLLALVERKFADMSTG